MRPRTSPARARATGAAAVAAVGPGSPARSREALPRLAHTARFALRRAGPLRFTALRDRPALRRRDAEHVRAPAVPARGAGPRPRGLRPGSMVRRASLPRATRRPRL